MNSYHRDGKAINPQLLLPSLRLLFPSAPSSLRLPARIRRGSRWRACGIFPTAQTSKHMFMIMGWINIGAKNHKRAERTESRKTEMKRRRGIFLMKLFLNPSVILLHYLLLHSPSQPVVIERAEMQYGACVRRRCLRVCVNTRGSLQVCSGLLCSTRCHTNDFFPTINLLKPYFSPVKSF